ncbi:tRNA (adenosine(37)-N6)-dimethylallyltransferase MiaA [Limnovirga soli]|uniref:tRNA dimethylallyltransferase n=1 Tax=Limnovirga soli TaxID=2656915 RepID=A0A8J8FHF4_9BACT|nr:tRNA (adenosine(37)-N6)-dimethylallyltransferase MiaA [Limnovirga soli]NNV56662.1 tRNA (adenosine(37)-N6)-dimethylallyltransferase MiaA [Limnovirga soli]
MAPKKNTVIIIAGATASGKTSLAIQLAQHFNTEIISADSRQCFKELNIGVAKPSPEELQLVPHHFISSHSITDDVTAQIFVQYALEKCNQVFQHNPIVIMAGGTGLYIKAFCEGLDPIPNADKDIRAFIALQYQTNGLAWLQNEVSTKDPLFWQQCEQQNPQRLMRALEIKLSTGNSIIHYRNRQIAERPFNIIKLGLSVEKTLLHSNINQRVDSMMSAGLLKEAANLRSYAYLNALQTVGYKEFFAYFDGITTLNLAIEAIKINTRHYAKRQITWFKKDTSINWFDSKFAFESSLKLLQKRM